jgi:hypothetical protein
MSDDTWDATEAVIAKLLEGGITYTESDGDLGPLIRMVDALAKESTKES